MSPGRRSEPSPIPDHFGTIIIMLIIIITKQLILTEQMFPALYSDLHLIL